MKNILFVVGDGIGNQVQTLPAFFYCKKRYPDMSIYVYNVIPTQTSITDFLFSGYCNDIYYSKKDISKYRFNFQILTSACYGSQFKGIKVKNNMLLSQVHKLSEIRFNLMSVDNHFTKKDFNIVPNILKKISVNKNIPDILIHNGYSKINEWSKKVWFPKSYSRYEKLAKQLKKMGFTVGSIGSKDEYINGTINLTESKLRHSIGMIRSCKLLISNDTSTYHLANAVGTKNIVIFTFTDPIKNFDKDFHKYTTIIRREDLNCSPCQLKGEFGHWLEKDCGWKCRKIQVNQIVQEVEKILL